MSSPHGRATPLTASHSGNLAFISESDTEIIVTSPWAAPNRLASRLLIRAITRDADPRRGFRSVQQAFAYRTRRLSPPWDVIEHRESFQVRTANGLGVAFVYFEEENPTRRFEMGRLTKDEARRVAANIAKLPELLKKES